MIFFYEAFLVEKKTQKHSNNMNIFFLIMVVIDNTTIFNINVEYFSLGIFVSFGCLCSLKLVVQKWFLEQQNILIICAQIKKLQSPSFG